MTKITTLSLFYFGTTVTLENRDLDFDEGSGIISTSLKVGDYSLTELAAELARALTVAGTQVYSATVDRVTRRITVSAPGSFSISANTGPNYGTSAWPLLGWPKSADYGPATGFLGPNGVGKAYKTQYPVDNYVSDEHHLRKEQATVNATPGGVVQLVSFNDTRIIEMNIRVITPKLGLRMTPFFENANGVQDFLEFIEYAMTKARIEFMPDADDPSDYKIVYLNTTPESSSGTEFNLKNMGAPDYYMSGLLTFRKVGP